MERASSSRCTTHEISISEMPARDSPERSAVGGWGEGAEMPKATISLNFKILAAVLIPTAALFLVFVLWAERATTDALKQSQENTTALVVAALGEDLVQSGTIDAAYAQRSLESIMQRFNIVLRINLYVEKDGQGRVLASTQPSLIGTLADENDLRPIVTGITTHLERRIGTLHVLESLAPIRYQGAPIGSLGIYASLEKVDSLIAAYRWRAGLLAIGTFLLIFLAQWMIMRRTILRPISALVSACRRVALGDLDYRVPERQASVTYDELDSLIEAYNRMGETIQLDRERIEELATRDDLTGLLNYRAFFQRLEEEVQRSRRYRHPVSLLILDADGFKEINDRWGHPVGNQVLRHFSLRILSSHLRSPDIAARYGGDEFALILPETDKEGGFNVARRILEATQVPLPLEGFAPVMFPVSIGVATLPDDAETAAGLVTAADDAMYQAKRAGGRRAIKA